MAGLGDIPPEIIEHIAVLADPLDLPALAQTASLYHAIINPPNYQRLWQILYLTQPLDDPRICRNQYGRLTFQPSFDWRKELQKIMRAKKVVLSSRPHTQVERYAVLETLLYLITNIPSTTSPARSTSLNLAWVAILLQNSTFLDIPCPLSPQENQLRSRIHAHFGLTKSDLSNANLTKSRGYIYDMRNYCIDTNYGPFMCDPDNDEDDWQPGKLVNWRHVQALHHVLSMHTVEDGLAEFKKRQVKGKWKEGEDEFKDFEFIHYPLSLPYCQSVIPEGLDLDAELDWAGVEGMWEGSFCYFSHRELTLYNRFGLGVAPLDTSFFDKTYFRETLKTMTVDIHITGTEVDLLHPTRPKLHFSGGDPVNQPFIGWVAYTHDGNIRWYFTCGDDGRMTWCFSGVQVGAVRSPFGVLGGWTTVAHTPLSPVGSFWFHKINDAIKHQLGVDGTGDNIYPVN